MSYTALKHELEHDPLGIGYAKMSDEEVVRALSRRTRLIQYEKKKPLRQAISGLNIGDLIVLKHELERLVQVPRVAAAMLEHVNAHLSGESKEQLLSSEEPDLGDPDVLAVIEALPHFDPVAKHTLRTMAVGQDPDAPKELGTKAISRAEELGLREVSVEEVSKIRSAIIKRR